MFKALPQHGSTASVPTQALASRLYMQSKALNELNDKGRQATQIGPQNVPKRMLIRMTQKAPKDPRGKQKPTSQPKAVGHFSSLNSLFFSSFFFGS